MDKREQEESQVIFLGLTIAVLCTILVAIVAGAFNLASGDDSPLVTEETMIDR